jgi:hypothetical protein
LAAGAVARRIQDLGWLNPGATEYGVKQVLVKRRGDIVRMMKAPELESQFPAEDVRCEQVVAASGEL